MGVEVEAAGAEEGRKREAAVAHHNLCLRVNINIVNCREREERRGEGRERERRGEFVNAW